MNTLKFSISNTKTGDIVVLLHDSSTKQITADTLPKVIEYIYEQGYTFDVLTNVK
jgi:peptidoglycan/xylan/chitin deacetylase (PgdA/CDA1 family)